MTEARIAPDNPSHWERPLRPRLMEADESALAEIYDKYASFVFGLALRVIGDRTAAEDVSQDVFMSIWESPSSFDPDRGSLRTWLGTLTHRRAVDYVRREEARRRRAQRAANSRQDSAASVDDEATSSVVANRVRGVLDILPDDQRIAIQIAYFGGKTYREVARVLGIPEGTAKSRLRLGLRRLAEALEPEGLAQWA